MEAATSAIDEMNTMTVQTLLCLLKKFISLF